MTARNLETEGARASPFAFARRLCALAGIWYSLFSFVPGSPAHATSIEFVRVGRSPAKSPVYLTERPTTIMGQTLDAPEAATVAAFWRPEGSNAWDYSRPIAVPRSRVFSIEGIEFENPGLYRLVLAVLPADWASTERRVQEDAWRSAIAVSPVLSVDVRDGAVSGRDGEGASHQPEISIASIDRQTISDDRSIAVSDRADVVCQRAR